MRVLHVIIREHLEHCRDKHKGPYWPKCLCSKWVDGMLNGKRIRRSLDTPDWSEAERKVLQIERAGGIFDDKLLADAIKEWEASWEISETSKRKYRRLMTSFGKWAATGDVQTVDDVTVPVLQAFYNTRTVAPRSKVKEVQVLRSFFRFCIRMLWTRENPALSISTPKNIKPNEVVPYTQDEMIAMLSACNRISDHNNNEQGEYARLRARAMILLLWQTGLRIGDAYGLKRSAVKNGTLILHTQKTGDPIIRTLSPELKQALEAVPLPMKDESDGAYFFWTGADGAVKNPRSHRTTIHAIRMLQPVFKESGVKDAHAHRFRHTLATQMLAAGATMADVAMALGNTVAICEKYYAKYDSHRQKRVDNLIQLAQGRGRLLERSEKSDSTSLKDNLVNMAEREGFDLSRDISTNDCNTDEGEEKPKRAI